MILGLITYSFIAKWYVWPWLKKWQRYDALVLLLFIASFRRIGLLFVIPGVVEPSISQTFAIHAAYGDLVSALLAIAAMIALGFRWRVGVPLVWLYGFSAVADVINVVRLANQFNVYPQLGAGFFITSLLVPALYVTLIMMVVILLKPRFGADENNPPQEK